VTSIHFPAAINRIVEPKPASGVLQIGRGAMRNFSPGIWTCAALYAAIGLVGVFFLMSEPGIATSSEGYGIAAIAAPASLR